MRSTRIAANINFAFPPTSDRAKVLMAATSRVATALGRSLGLHASPRRMGGGLTASLPDPCNSGERWDDRAWGHLKRSASTPVMVGPKLN
jgi:hypothetical protein